jgi:hypothetical protein
VKSDADDGGKKQLPKDGTGARVGIGHRRLRDHTKRQNETGSQFKECHGQLDG